MKSEKIETSQGAIEYSSWGNGEPILVIHGIHSNCQERLFHKGIDLKRYQLIIPSRPGYGATPLVKGSTLKKAAQLIIALLNHLKINKTIVYGVSAGGLTAIELAGNYPERVTKLILASAVSKRWLIPDDRMYKKAQIIFHPKVENFTWRLIRTFSYLTPKSVTKIFHSQFSVKKLEDITEKEIFEILQMLKRYQSQEGFLADIKQEVEVSVLKKITSPTLIIHSENDNTIPLEHAQHAHRMIPGSTLIKLQNDWGHLLWVGRDSCQSVQTIVDFIEK